MKRLLLVLGLGISVFACNRNEQETPEPTDFGYLSMNIVLSIEEVPATGRIEAVSTDDWSVTIFNALDDSEVINFTPFIDAPAEVQLPTGEYYMEAHSNNFAEAAFENPYYFGRSANFEIDKEELTAIDIDAELANSKVAINYSANVTSTFDTYSGAVSVVSTGTSLAYAQSETREGYFVAEPLSVVVDLSYEKVDGTFITRQFTADIDAQPKTLYNINVDATLEDGEIMLNINVDETFDTEEINIGDVVVSGECIFNQFVLMEDGDIETSDISYSGDEISQIVFSTNYDPGSTTINVTYNTEGQISLIESEGLDRFREEYTYDGLGRIVERNRYKDSGTGYRFSSRDLYVYNDDGQLASFTQLRGLETSPTLDYREVYFYANAASQDPFKYEAFNSSDVNYKDVFLTYDDTSNPIKASGLWICDDCFDFELPAFTTNNITALEEYDADETVLNWEINSIVEYKTSGLIKKVTYTEGGGDSFVHEFGYTCD